MRAFDVSFRRAALAYNRFDDSVRTIASYRQSGSFPSDWGNHVRDVMSFIRLAKVSLTKAINDATTAAEDESLRDDELYELSDSEALLNSRLQRVIAVEESLLNTILSGDADYVSMYLASQQAHQDIEARIRKIAYGDSEPTEVPESVEEEPDEVIEDMETEEEPADEEDETEEPEEYSEDTEDESGEGTEYEGDDEEISDDDEQTEDIEEESEEDCADGEYSEDDDGTQGRHMALVFDDDGTVHMANIQDAYVMEDPDSVPFVEIDDEDATPEADEVEDGLEPAPQKEPEAPANVSDLTLEQKARLVMNDPDIQRFIHDEANRQARAQYQAMVFEAASMTPKETRIAVTPQQIPVNESEPEVKNEPEPVKVEKVEPEPITTSEPAKEPAKKPGRSTGTSSSRGSKKKQKPAKPEKTGRTFRLRKPKDGE